MNDSASFVFDRLQTVSVPARKLFALIVQEAYRGPLHPKPKGTATPPEILEACSLDVADFYALLAILGKAGLIRVTNTYPFEEIQLSEDAAEAEALAERCRRDGIPFEEMFVSLSRRPSERPPSERRPSERPPSEHPPSEHPPSERPPSERL